MNGQTSHADVDELLPWYANGTLASDEREAVERHLDQCTRCQNELTLLREVASTAREAVAAVPAVPDRLSETFARIDQWERSKAPSLSSRIAAFFDTLLHPPSVRWALAAQFVVILALGGVMLLRPGSSYTTLSGGSTGTAAGARLTVTFQPAATADAIRAALRAVDANVVSGPSAAGVYVVEVPTTNAAAVDTAIDTLRANSSVINFVERQP
jgi:anti-sigma factor RsiW